MSILELPIELLQLMIDIAVQHTDSQRAVRFRETCRQFDEVVKSSIFHLPKKDLLQWRLSTPMRRRFVRLKMLHEDANELLLCYTINRTADYLADRTTPVSRDRYVQVLESSAVNTLMYWRLLDCLTTERQRYLPLEELKDNALVAAVGTGEISTAQKLLEEGANPASNTPLFGEPLAMAASSGSLDMIHLLLAHWDWEDHAQPTGLRLVKAVESAAVAGHESVLAKLLDHKNRIAWYAYDDAIVRMIECNHTASVERLLALRKADPTPAAKDEFWLRFVRTAAEYDRRTLLQRILAEHLSDIRESSLMNAIQDACLENHGHVVQTIIPHLSVSDRSNQFYYNHESIFWAARHGNVETLQHLLKFFQSDRRSLLVAFAGAISGNASEAIEHLSKVTGVSPVGEHVATRFTDIARVMCSDKIVKPTEPIVFIDRTVRRAMRGRGLADVINVSDTLKAYHPEDTLGSSILFSDAANCRRLDVLLFLCENWTPFRRISSVKSPAQAQMFIDFGWDMNQKEQGLRSPPAERFLRDKHFTRWLLDKGAVADAKTEFDITTVSYAVMRASIPTIKLLLSRSSGIQHGQLLHFAVQRTGDFYDTAQMRDRLYYALKRTGGPWSPDQRRAEDSREIMELLLNLGCPIDSIWFQDDPHSWLQWGQREAGTALFTAAEQGRDDMVAYLLSRGADATVVSNKGRTALDAARSNQHSRVVQLLR